MSVQEKQAQKIDRLKNKTKIGGLSGFKNKSKTKTYMQWSHDTSRIWAAFAC